MPPVSDTVAGLAMIAGGLGILWSARAAVDVSLDVRLHLREEWERRYGWPPPWWVAAAWGGPRRAWVILGYAFGLLGVVGGLIVFLR